MTAIKVENLSKKYIINHEGQERYTAMRDVVARKVKKIFSFPKSLKPGPFYNKEEFYALRDINFEIQQGDRVGIIGRNGAGKSTLLKVLSRITEPTTGKITINGRVASLLEVGTGFHPELTGKENIYLNGAVLGMSRQEIRTKFDEIVDFAGIEKFLDTPVKRYSSGMYVRLAFSVAAHLEPEILIVDEVLAVGDSEFQEKCLGKMNEVSKSQGRTVIFVSHSMSAIVQLCNKGILLNKGTIICQDKSSKIVEEYNSFERQLTESYINIGAKEYEIQSVSCDENGLIFDYKNKISIKIKLNIYSKISGLHLGVAVNDKWKRKIFTSQYVIKDTDILCGEVSKIMEIPSKLLLSGNYSLDVASFIPNSHTYSYLQNICQFKVNDLESEMAQYENADIGVINANCKWY